jgi:photosystem II stability/assembly factor-like uncharacterized protein
MKILFSILIILSLNALAQDRWIKLNGPEGGIMQGIIAKGDTVVAGKVDDALVFYSFDRGESWQQSKIRVKNRFTQFCFTDDGGIIVANPSLGVYKSNDFINWTRLNVNGEFWSVGNDKQGKIYAGTDYGELFTSSNNGINWTMDMWAGGRIHNFYLSPYNKLFAGVDKKILVKDLSTSNWTVINMDSTNGEFRVFEGPNELIFAVTATKISISIDSGRTWKYQPTGTFFNGELMTDCIYNTRLIGVFLGDIPWFGTGGWGAAVSDDLGITWRWSQKGLPPKISGQRLVKSGNDTYMTTWGAGVYKSTDFGDNWFSVNNGIYAATVMDIHFDNDGILYAASWSNGLSRSKDMGEKWEMINKGVTNVNFYSIISDDTGILLAGSDRGTFRSSDKGENWVGITGPGNNYVFHFWKDKYRRIYALTYGSGFYRTTDSGDSWLRMDKNFNSGFIFGLAMDKEKNLYAGGRGGGAIYKSTDDGSSWIKVYQGISDAIISEIVITPDDYIFANSIYEGVLRSTNRGLTWELMNNGLPSKRLQRISISPNGRLYLSLLGGGIYASDNEGENWYYASDNLGLTIVNEFLFHEKHLYLATNESVWKSNPDTVTSIAEDDIKPKEYFLSQNYPNPFNPVTIIKFSIAGEDRVTLKIYDLLGREVKTLIDKDLKPGEYQVEFNSGELASGVYIYRISSGSYSSVKKMQILK